jgi:hypothetical protein
MHTDDAVELAKNIKTVGYSEWTDVVDGLLYQTCGDCGDSHVVMIKQTGPDMCRVRLVREEQLTAATRENESMEIPLYREVLRLREENINLRRDLTTATNEVSDLRAFIDGLKVHVLAAAKMFGL